MITSVPTKRILAISQWKTFLRVFPTRWRQKPAGVEITWLTLCILRDVHRPTTAIRCFYRSARTQLSKRQMVFINAREGCPCWILSPLTVCANYCFCYFHSLFKWKIWKTCVVVKFSNKFQMHWIFMQTRQRNLETFDIISHAFLPLTVAKLSTLKNSPVFGPPCKYRKGDQNTER